MQRIATEHRRRVNAERNLLLYIFPFAFDSKFQLQSLLALQMFFINPTKLAFHARLCSRQADIHWHKLGVSVQRGALERMNRVLVLYPTLRFGFVDALSENDIIALLAL